MINYSDREKELFESLACGDLLSQEPHLAYRAAAEFCFLNDYKGPSVESLRKCLRVIVEGGLPKRSTKDFDNLIDVGIYSKGAYEQGSSYIVVYDTFGEGLRTISLGDVDIYHSEKELKEGIIETYYQVPDCNDFVDGASEDKVDPNVIEAMVICKVVDMADYAKGVIKDYLDGQKSEDYRKYLELKERFDP
jgi:hypothetical protein